LYEKLINGLRGYIVKLKNPTLFSFQMNKLEVNGSGEKRKSTPPDLLALSQMYFERNQVLV
jgi:hypothetical protein